MEAIGRDGRRVPCGLGTSSSTTSGTGSTGYTPTSSQQSWISIMEAARQIQEMEMEDLEFVPSPKETASHKNMKRIKILAKEFFSAPSSAKFSIEGAELSVLERWFRELGVAWVIHVADGGPAGELEHALDASSWIPALNEIRHTFCLVLWFLPGHGSAEKDEPATESDEEQNMAEEQLQLASFTQQAMLKMLTFVDFIVAPNLTCDVFVADGVPMPAPYDKLLTLLHVREPLSKALFWIRLPFDSSSYAEVARIHGEIVDVLSAKEDKVGEAIWSTLEEIRTRLLESPEEGQGSSGTQTPQGSSDIDKATRSVMMYVTFLQHNYWLLTPVVLEADSLGKYVPRFGAVQPLTSLAMEMISFLEEKLANKSEASPDQGLRFLFLLNNSSFIADQLHDTPYFPKSYKVDLAGKAEDYIKMYIQKMNTTQKLWKVPDPKLRNRLRRAIIDEVIPVYTRYLLAVDYGNAPLKFSPSYLQEMLQELFEG
ncbi:hypothetical protein PAHAL_7G126500 [Panicum hallii]|uniref:Exocyst subunit Exo70 family protein n=1 Tax=Panicum hallii TaxID=206008 RepID=A0A2T8IC10_9POAL|nr:uncharacterized protein LOC112900985 [Panicum hallii]PVH35204.1 hypothetical protein PAHAL_7G126500 [Panicum hallii]